MKCCVLILLIVVQLASCATYNVEEQAQIEICKGVEACVIKVEARIEADREYQREDKLMLARERYDNLSKRCNKSGMVIMVRCDSASRACGRWNHGQLSIHELQSARCAHMNWR